MKSQVGYVEIVGKYFTFLFVNIKKPFKRGFNGFRRLKNDSNFGGAV